MLNKHILGRLAVLSIVVLSGAPHVVQAATSAAPVKKAASSSVVSATAARAEILALQKQVQVGKSVTFASSVLMETPTGGSATYEIEGRLQRPNRIFITETHAGAPVATMACDGITSIVYAASTGRFLKAVASSDGMPNDPGLKPFINSDAGPAAFNALYLVVQQFFNPRFDLGGNDPLPPGATKKYTIRQTLGQLKGKPVVTSTQEVALYGKNGESSVIELKTVYSKAPWSLSQFGVRVGQTPKLTKQMFLMNFSSFALNGVSETDPAGFRFAPPTTAAAFAPPANLPDGTPETLGVGSSAPDFSVVDTAGKTVKLSDYNGKVVVLDLWATWCAPCQAEMPYTAKIASEYQPKGVVFLPVCYGDTQDKFSAWVAAHTNLPMTFLFDPAAKTSVSFADSLYAVNQTIPTQFVIGKDGKIVATLVGYDEQGDPTETTLRNALDIALAPG